MSVDYEATAIIGCKIDDPYIIVKKRSCYHQESMAKFCEECGKSMWIEEKTISPILEAFEEDGKGIRYIQTCMGERHYVGIYIAKVDQNENEVKIGLEAFQKERLSNLLKTILKNLYKPENFGFWLILDAG